MISYRATRASTLTDHALAYDPRRDVDHVRPYAETLCGQAIYEAQLIDSRHARRRCATCDRIEAGMRRT